MFREFFQKNNCFDVIIAGSILVDVISKVPAGTDFIGTYDCVGVLDEYRIGGCGYNIFVHLAEKDVRSILCTGLKRNSIFSNFLIEKIREHCNDLSLIALEDVSSEPAFVCHVRSNGVYAAITSTCIEDCTLPYSRIKRVAEQARCFVLDCSLSQSQITQLIGIARKNKCQVIFNGTSDGRIPVIKTISGWETPIDILVCNKKEFSVLHGDESLDYRMLDTKIVCNIARSHMVIITFGAEGYCVFRRDESNVKHYPAIESSQNIVSSVGAGDALTAAFAIEIIESCKHGRDVNLEAAFSIFSGLFRTLSKEMGATAKSGSLYSHEILPPPSGVYNSFKTLWLSRHIWNRWSAPIGALGILTTIIAILVTLYPSWGPFSQSLIRELNNKNHQENLIMNSVGSDKVIRNKM